MKFFPYERFVIESPLRVGDSYARLESATSAKNWRKALGKWRLSLSGSEFSLQRAATTRHGIFAKGRIFETPCGSRVVITIMPHWTVVLFLLFWCGGLNFAIVEIINEMIAKKAFDNNILPLLVMFFGGYAILMFGWNKEARNVTKFLKDTLDIRY